MGVPSDFQYIPAGYIGILISVAVVAVSLAVYYQLSKGYSSNQRHEYSSRASDQSTFYQQNSLTTIGHDGRIASKREIIQRYATNIHSNSTLLSGIDGEQGNSISALHSGISSGTASVDIAEKMVMDCQSSKKSTVATGSTRLSDEKSTYVMEAIVPNTTSLSPLMTRMDKWSERKTTTMETESFVTSAEPTLDDLGTNQSMNGPLLATMKSTASRSIDTEHLQQLSVNGKLDNKWGNGGIDDKVQQANNDSEDGTTEAKSDAPAEPSVHQTNISDWAQENSTMDYAELPDLTQTDGDINTNESLEKSVMGTYNKDKNDKPTMPFDYTAPHSLMHHRHLETQQKKDLSKGKDITTNENETTCRNRYPISHQHQTRFNASSLSQY
ncbi:unnamed protein product [Absidia cylindrospora]